MIFSIKDSTIEDVRNNFERTIFMEVRNPLDSAAEVTSSKETFNVLMIALDRDNLLPKHNGINYIYPGSNCKITIT